LQLDRVKLVIIVLLEVRGLSIVLIIVVLVNTAQLAQQISILQLVLLAIINQIRFSQLATYVWRDSIALLEFKTISLLTSAPRATIAQPELQVQLSIHAK